jgi:hypothetical protein
MHWALHETDFKPNEQAGVSLVTKTADSFRRFFDVYSNITVTTHHGRPLPLAFSLAPYLSILSAKKAGLPRR